MSQAAVAVAELRGAVATLLVSADTPREQRRAQAWLERFRRDSLSAWTTSLAALTAGGGGGGAYELCLFSAQTLALLARRRELGQDGAWAGRLREVLGLMAAWAGQPHGRAVVAQLALAAAALLVRHAALEMPLHGALAEAMHCLLGRTAGEGEDEGRRSGVAEGRGFPPLLSPAVHAATMASFGSGQGQAWLALLAALPEEAAGAHNRLPADRRSGARAGLREGCGPAVAGSLAALVQDGDAETAATAFTALRAWVEQDALDLAHAEQGLALAFARLREMCEAGQAESRPRQWTSAVELLHAAMDTYTGTATAALFMQELLLLETYAPLLQDVCNLFVGCCVAALNALMEPALTALWQRMFNVVLECTRTRDLDVAGATLELWAVLPDYIPPPLADGLEDLLQAAVAALLAACAFPPDYASRPAEWQAALEEHRDNARAALRGFVRCCPVLRLWLAGTAAEHLEAAVAAAEALAEQGQAQARGSETMLDRRGRVEAGHSQPSSAGGGHGGGTVSAASSSPASFPTAAAAAVAARVSPASDEPEWRQAEAVLHVISAVARPLFSMVPGSDDPPALQDVLYRIAAAFPRLPTHPALQRTLALLMGGIWGWLGQRPALAESAFLILVRALALPEEDALYPMRLTENHAACIGLLKLSRVPQSAAAFSLLGEAYSTQLHLGAPTVSHASLRLLVQALCQCIEHAVSSTDASQGLATLLGMIVPRAAQLVPVVHHVRGAVPPLVCALEEWATVARCFKRADAPAMLGEAMRSQCCEADACLPLLLLGSADGRAPAAALPEVMAACRELALALLTNAAEPVPDLTLLVVRLFWQHFLHVQRSPACLEVLRCGLELHGSRDEAVFGFYSEAVPALIDALGPDLIRGETPATELCEETFKLLAAACSCLPRVVWPQVDALLTLVTQTMTPDCRPLLQQGGPARALLGLVMSMCQRSAAGGEHKDAALGSTIEGMSGRTAALNGGSVGATADAPALCDAVFAAVPDAAVHLLAGLLHCVCDLMPSYMLEDVVLVLRNLLAGYGTATVCAWLAEAISLPHFPRSGTRPAAKQQFLDDVARNAEQRQWPRLKNAVKVFCGGKKKGSAGTPGAGSSADAERERSSVADLPAGGFVRQRQFSTPPPDSSDALEAARAAGAGLGVLSREGALRTFSI